MSLSIQASFDSKSGKKKQIKVKDPPRQQSYDGDAFVKHFQQRGAREILVLDPKGQPIRSTTSRRRSYMYSAYLHALINMARNTVRDLDPSNDVTFLRMRSASREVLITISADFSLIAIQRLHLKKHGKNTEKL